MRAKRTPSLILSPRSVRKWRVMTDLVPSRAREAAGPCLLSDIVRSHRRVIFARQKHASVVLSKQCSFAYDIIITTKNNTIQNSRKTEVACCMLMDYTDKKEKEKRIHK